MIKDMCTIIFLKWTWKRHNYMVILQIFKERDYQGRGKNETSHETLTKLGQRKTSDKQCFPDFS